MLGIIIINYNTFEKTIDCIKSIEDTYKGDYKIYLLDNYSINESAEILKKKYEYDIHVELILENRNLGYARGNNKCLSMAREDGCEYVIISNNDIIYKEKAIENLIKEIQSENAFLVGPKVSKPTGEVQNTVKYKAPNYIEYLLRETYLRSFISKIWNMKHSIPSVSMDVYWIAGCTFIVDVEQFYKIGFFDDYTFLYYEEYILSEKAKKNSLRIRFFPGAEVIHYHGFSMGGPLNIVTRSANWRSESYFIKNYWNWNYVMRWILWQIRVMEIRFNARKEPNKRKLIKEYKKGKKYL